MAINNTVLQDYTEALRLVDGDHTAAASLALASALRDSQTAPANENAHDQPLSVTEAAKRLHVAPNTVYHLCQKGLLGHHRIGKIIRIMPADIETYQREGAKPKPPRGRFSELRI
jgi:excisionase family DNA binding protein